MGVIPYELLVPLGQLKALNLSGNHLVNVSMQILHPVDGLQVSKSGSGSSSSNKMLIHHFYFSGCLCSFLFSKSNFIRFVQLLDISRNQLNGIEDSQAIMLQKIKEVRLENNPLICDRCHMGSLIQMAKTVSSFRSIFMPFANKQKTFFKKKNKNKCIRLLLLFRFILCVFTASMEFTSDLLSAGISARNSNIRFKHWIAGSVHSSRIIARWNIWCGQHIAQFSHAW